MKKIILCLLTVFLFAAVFTGCPHETTPTEEEAPGKYPRNIIFDKKTFDAKQKAWNNSGIKDYQFSQIYYQYKCLVCRTTVKNGTVTAREFFWKDSNNPENTYNNLVNFDDCVTYDPYVVTDEQERENIRNQPNYIDYEFIKGKDKVPYSTIDEVYSSINNWYTDLSSKDFEAEEIAQALIEVNYMTDYPIPAEYGADFASEFEYDDALNIYGHFEFHGYPIPESGWQDKIFDFKVLSN